MPRVDWTQPHPLLRRHRQQQLPGPTHRSPQRLVDQPHQILRHMVEVGAHPRQPARHLVLQVRQQHLARHLEPHQRLAHVPDQAGVRLHLKRGHIPVPDRMQRLTLLDAVRDIRRFRRRILHQPRDQPVPIIGQVLLDHPERRDVHRCIAGTVDVLALARLADLPVQLRVAEAQIEEHVAVGRVMRALVGRPDVVAEALQPRRCVRRCLLLDHVRVGVGRTLRQHRQLQDLDEVLFAQPRRQRLHRRPHVELVLQLLQLGRLHQPALVRLNAVHQRLQALLRLAGNLVADAAHTNPLHCSPPQAGACCRGYRERPRSASSPCHPPRARHGGYHPPRKLR